MFPYFPRSVSGIRQARSWVECLGGTEGREIRRELAAQMSNVRLVYTFGTSVGRVGNGS